MLLSTSYFSIDNPLHWLDRCLNSFQERKNVHINRREVEITWTRRADTALHRLQQPLIIELQLYFSCVVKKRVLFHRQVDFETIAVNGKIEIAFRAISSAVCNPKKFARDYPEGKNLSAGPASRMVPRVVEIDYRNDEWEGQFALCKAG